MTLFDKISQLEVIDDEIQSDFMHFSKGDSIFDLWHWLEENDNKLTLGDLL